MKALIQRVSEAEAVTQDGTVGRIAHGMLVFLGIEKGDKDRDLEYLIKKITNLRIFGDEQRKMNRSIRDINGAILVVSQFTLSADCSKGNRPSFDSAEVPDQAKEMYERFIRRLRENAIMVATGNFGAFMQVRLVNDGPVTIMLDSRE